MMEVMSRRLVLPPVHRRRLLGGAAVLGAAVTWPLAARVSAETGSARLPADEVPPKPRPERFTFLEAVDPRALESNNPVLDIVTTTSVAG